ncbi:hypothetical protein [Marinobacter sp.]|uniref:hypothetical protein n=1 Tax=Marinobacter sp. TaxID=50741 RepID=UPI0034A569B2
MFKKTLLSLAVASSLGLTGCFDSAGSGKNANPEYKISNPAIDGKTWPLFNPVTSELPVPNDLIFDSVASDGTFRVTDTAPPVTTALNSLSGASTVAPPVVQFNGQIDADTVVANQSVFLIELAYASGDPVQGLGAGEPPTLELAISGPSALPQFQTEVVSLDGTSAIRILPLKPLNPRKRYIVAVTKDITDINGDATIQSPSYNNLTDETQPLGTATLAPVRTLINSLWEPIAEAYFGAVGAGLTSDDIALSYSFTTSNDEKVLQYIAEPQAWFADQLTTFLRVSAAKAVVNGQLDLNADETVDFSDVNLAADGAVAGFPDEDTQAALATLFEGGAPCDGQTDQDAIECVGVNLAAAPSAMGGFADLLPTPAAGTVTASADDAQDATSVSVLLTNFLDPGDVNVVQGTITLPYYLGTSGAELVTNSWQADDTLASAMNTAFADLGLEIPQADPTVSTTVNYIFPFPKETEEVMVPMLVIYPTGAAMDGTTPVVVFQHGITTDRSAALAFGSSLANATGTAVVAIDQPLHGVSPFSVDDQLELAGTLLEASDPALNTEENREAVVDQLFSVGVTINIDSQCNETITDPSDEDQIAAAQASILAGDCGPDAQASLAGALGIESTVARAGSTIPGLEPTGNERHFNLTADANNQPTPMVFDPENAVGSSGSLFINLSNFLTGRDNLRQGSVDLMNLRASLGEIDLDDNGTGDLATDNVFFIGHSLGTVNGTPYVASVNANQVQFGGVKTSDDIFAANMLTPGGGIVRLLENSPTFSPAILGGLAAAAGLEQGDANLETYFNVFQAALDTVDPINFADNLLTSSTPTLLSEIVGDTVIPNDAFPDTLGNAFQAPLAGTEPLATELEATTVATGNVVLDPAGITRYIEGNHGTPVFPSTGTTEESRVFGEMVGQAASFFFLNGGASVDVTDSGVIQQD